MQWRRRQAPEPVKLELYVGSESKAEGAPCCSPILGPPAPFSQLFRRTPAKLEASGVEGNRVDVAQPLQAPEPRSAASFSNPGSQELSFTQGREDLVFTKPMHQPDLSVRVFTSSAAEPIEPMDNESGVSELGSLAWLVHRHET